MHRYRADLTMGAEVSLKYDGHCLVAPYTGLVLHVTLRPPRNRVLPAGVWTMLFSIRIFNNLAFCSS